MASPVAADGRDAYRLSHQDRQQRAVLAVLVANRRRVVGRRELSRLAGLADLSERRCDSVLVGVRRLIGADGVVTVRGRGWMIAPHAVAAAERLLGPENLTS
jgi:DNA-binding response OmpR family regulator